MANVWNRLSKGQHVVLRGTSPVPEPDPARLLLAWVDCEAFPQPRGTLNEARRRMGQVLEVAPPCWMPLPAGCAPVFGAICSEMSSKTRRSRAIAKPFSVPWPGDNPAWLVESLQLNADKGSRAGLEFNLESLKSIAPHLPLGLQDRARALEQRLDQELSSGQGYGARIRQHPASAPSPA